jgi:hypothetical protein
MIVSTDADLAPLPVIWIAAAAQQRCRNRRLGTGQRTDLDVEDVGVVLLQPAAGQGGERSLGRRAPEEVEH